MKDHDSNATDPRDPADPVNRDSVSDSWGRAAAYDAYADGLHTYALGGLRHHEAASSAVYCAFVAADHHVAHLGDAEMLRPWLYAITRHYCRAGKLPRLRLTQPSAQAPAQSRASARSAAAVPKDAAMAELERTLLAAELASLDWPDTDGLSGAHREVLELSVRHGMESRAVGMMLGKPAAESFEVLSQAWHELERSLAALALLRTDRTHCPDLAALAEGWSGRLTAQRREPLVAHVDSCSRCQYHLHKVIGAPQAPSILPHVPAPQELRERVLGDLLDAGAEKAAAKAAIANRLAVFDPFGFPAIATMRMPSARPQTPPRTAAPMPVERRPRRLGALLAGRMSSAAAQAVVVEVASAPERLRTPAPASPDAKTPANTMDEGSGLDAVAVTAGTEQRRRLRRSSANSANSVDSADSVESVEPVESVESTGPMGSVSSESFTENPTENLSDQLAASFGPPRGSATDDTLISERHAGVFDDIRPARQTPETVDRGPVPPNSVAAAIEGRRRGVEDVRRGAVPVGDAYEAAAAVASAVAAGDFGGAQVPPIAPVGVMPTAVMPTAVMPVGMMPGSGSGSGSGGSSSSNRSRSARGSGGHGGRGAGGATGNGGGAHAPRDSTRVFARPVGAVAEPRRRKPGVKSALASSAVLSGVGAVGVTAFVLFVPSAPGGDKTLFTPPDPGTNGRQAPDYPRATSNPEAGPTLPVAGGAQAVGRPGNDAVTAQVVAAVVPGAPSSPSFPSAADNLPINGPLSPQPTQTGVAPSQDPSGNGQLHLSVSQRSNNPGDVTVTLWNSGTAPLSWTATPDAPWLHLSATSGMLAGGAQTSIHLFVDSAAEPNGSWTAHVRFDPGGQAVSISGTGGTGGSGGPGSSSSPSGPTTPTTSPTTPSSPASSAPSTPSSPTSPSSPVSTPSTPHTSTPSGPGASSATSSSPSGPRSPGSPSGPPTSTKPTTPASSPNGAQSHRPRRPH